MKAHRIGDGTQIGTPDLPLPMPGLLEHFEPAERNLQRGLIAGIGLSAFAERTRTDQESLETAMSDFLADLRHLADAVNLDWEVLNDRADRHYEAELAGE